MPPFLLLQNIQKLPFNSRMKIYILRMAFEAVRGLAAAHLRLWISHFTSALPFCVPQGPSLFISWDAM